MSKKRMTGEDRKAAIVRAALPLFARRGFAETTTKDLAKAAGISEPLLYKHFPSKEALYLEIQNSSCQGTDPVIKKLSEMGSSTEALVHLMYYLMRALVLGLPLGKPEWDTRHRLMLNSLLHDGTFARLIYQNRFDCFCSRMEACLEAALAAGDAVAMPVTMANRARFSHHVGAWVASVHLPKKAAMDYHAKRTDLLNQAMWYVLRGMGLTDAAIEKHFQPKELESFFEQAERRPVKETKTKAGGA